MVLDSLANCSLYVVLFLTFSCTFIFFRGKRIKNKVIVNRFTSLPYFTYWIWVNFIFALSIGTLLRVSPNGSREVFQVLGYESIKQINLLLGYNIIPVSFFYGLGLVMSLAITISFVSFYAVFPYICSKSILRKLLLQYLEKEGKRHKFLIKKEIILLILATIYLLLWVKQGNDKPKLDYITSLVALVIFFTYILAYRRELIFKKNNIINLSESRIRKLVNVSRKKFSKKFLYSYLFFQISILSTVALTPLIYCDFDLKYMAEFPRKNRVQFDNILKFVLVDGNKNTNLLGDSTASIVLFMKTQSIQFNALNNLSPMQVKTFFKYIKNSELGSIEVECDFLNNLGSNLNLCSK